VAAAVAAAAAAARTAKKTKCGRLRAAALDSRPLSGGGPVKNEKRGGYDRTPRGRAAIAYEATT